jgi:hypothetical protein
MAFYVGVNPEKGFALGKYAPQKNKKLADLLLSLYDYIAWFIGRDQH